jgi:hypothetical protein
MMLSPVFFNRLRVERRLPSQRHDAMTCRIDRLPERNLVVLRISGRIALDDVDVLRSAIDQERSAIAIDLGEVGLVERDAVNLLALSEARGVELRNCPPYIREWIAREQEKP